MSKTNRQMKMDLGSNAYTLEDHRDTVKEIVGQKVIAYRQIYAEMGKLTRLAAIAFVARCSHRWLRFYSSSWPDLSNEHRRIIDIGVVLVEQYAAGNADLDQLRSAREALKSVDKAAFAKAPNLAPTSLVLHVTNALEAVLSDDAPLAAAASLQSFQIHASMSENLANEDSKFKDLAELMDLDLQLANRDYLHLREAIETNAWTDETTVSPSFFEELYPRSHRPDDELGAIALVGAIKVIEEILKGERPSRQTTRLVKMLAKREFTYSILGLVVGLILTVIGAVLTVNGVAGSTSWTMKLYGIESNLIDAGTGIVFVIVGLFVILLTRPKVTFEKRLSSNSTDKKPEKLPKMNK